MGCRDRALPVHGRDRAGRIPRPRRRRCLHELPRRLAPSVGGRYRRVADGARPGSSGFDRRISGCLGEAGRALPKRCRRDLPGARPLDRARRAIPRVLRATRRGSPWVRGPSPLDADHPGRRGCRRDTGDQAAGCAHACLPVARRVRRVDAGSELSLLQRPHRPCVWLVARSIDPGADRRPDGRPGRGLRAFHAGRSRGPRGHPWELVRRCPRRIRRRTLAGPRVRVRRSPVRRGHRDHGAQPARPLAAPGVLDRAPWARRRHRSAAREQIPSRPGRRP